MTTRYFNFLKKVSLCLGGKKIVILSGGDSSESEISRRTALRVSLALKEMGFRVSQIDPSVNRNLLFRKLENAGLVFLGLHGGCGEDGTIQGWLDFHKLPYTGTSVLGSSIGANKLITKKILIANKILTPPYVAMRECLGGKGFFTQLVEKKLGYPVILKIANEGSGKGVFLAKNKMNFLKILKDVGVRPDLFAEAYIPGREISIGIIGINNKSVVLPILEAKYRGEILSYEGRYNQKGHIKEVPAKLSKRMEKKLKTIALLCHRSLFAQGYSRIDIRLDERTEKPFVLEITTLPGLTRQSWLPAMAEKAGYEFKELVLLIMLSALAKYKTSFKTI